MLERNRMQAFTHALGAASLGALLMGCTKPAPTQASASPTANADPPAAPPDLPEIVVIASRMHSATPDRDAHMPKAANDNQSSNASRIARAPGATTSGPGG
jgi:hypothetical protein